MCSSTRGGHFLCLLATVLILHVTISHGQGIESIIIDENTPTYISISWDVEAGSSWEYYTVDVVKASGKSVNRYPTNTTVLSQLITGLRPVEEYTITVTPWTSEGSGESLNATVTTEAIAEGEILASKVTSSSAFIQWRKYETVFVYSVLYESSNVSKSLQGIFEPEVELPLPRPGTVFNVTVRGGNMDLASTQIRTEPEAPVNISLERIGTTEVTLSWTPPSTPHDAYEFYVVNNSTNERSLFTTEQGGDVSDYEMTLSGLLYATVYSFEVGTVLNAKDSFELQRSDQNENPVVFGRTEAIAEGEILASKVTSSSAFIQWRNYETVSVYTVLYESSDVSKSLQGIFEPEVELPLPRPGTVFNVTVRGGNMDLASTQIRTEPEAPVNISLERIGTTEVTLSWTPPSTPHDAYEFYVVNNSTNERSLFTTEQGGDVSDYEMTLSGLLYATVYSFEVGTVLNAKDSFELQRSDQNENPIVFGRTGPEAPLNIMVTDISNDSVIVTLTSPTSSHDAYELYLYNSTTNQKSLIVTIQRENDMKYSWTKSGLLPSTSYTVEGGTVLNAEGSFPIQRSEDNPMITFQTGDAVSPVLHYVLLLISLLAVFLE